MQKEIKISKAVPSHLAESSNLKIFRVVGIACFAIAGAAAIYTAWFVYNYTFNTINKIQSIGLLKSGAQIKQININLYEEVLKKINNKIPASAINGIKNPFVETATSTTPASRKP